MKFWVVTLATVLLSLTVRMSWAIGLGDIATQSFVNGSLSATIEVLQPDGLSEVEVIPSLASIDDFDRLGLDRHYSLSRLLFEPDFSDPSRPVIRITTQEPVVEPYLSFLMELKWPEGRILREYTVFLDLPPRAEQRATQRDTQRSSAQGIGELGSTQYRIAPNDTLGAIAQAFKPTGISTDQMMLAIKSANPESFVRNNINGIRAGVLIDIPTDLSQVPNARAAALEVASEWEQWRTPRSKGLRIVADNELFDSAVVATMRDEDAKISEVETPAQQPYVSPGESAGGRSASSELAAIEARLTLLSSQLQDIQAMVNTKDQEIARLEAELAERPVRVDEPPETVDNSQPVAAPTNNFYWLVGILLLGGVVWYGRQRFVAQRDARTEGAELTPANLMGKSVDDLLPVPKSRSVDAASVVAGESERGYGESLLTGYAADQSMADAVAEADIYVAYGRHQHALDTLEAASAAEPSSALGLMKMLEIYVSLDRIDEARELLGLIEATGDEGALVASQSKLDTHQAQLAGDQAAHDLAQGSQSENEEVLDLSLDLDFQQASRSVPEPEESDASGVLDSEDPGETALDLARAYLDMGDQTGAAELLQSVISMGDAAQCEQARALLDSLD
ncbi:hypothetical protein N8718_02400 [Luminiphilus sp.]|nr:hypothetical protein [Luminiphilus sp.]